MDEKKINFRDHVFMTLLSEAAIDADNLLNNRRTDLEAMQKVGEKLQNFVEQCLDEDFSKPGGWPVGYFNWSMFVGVMTKLDKELIVKNVEGSDRLNMLAKALVIVNRLARGKPTQLETNFCLIFSREIMSSLAENGSRHRVSTD